MQSFQAHLCCSNHARKLNKRVYDVVAKLCAVSDPCGPVLLLSFFLFLLHLCIQSIYRQGRFSYVPQHQSVRSGVQPCYRDVSYSLHQAFACYRNNITSWIIPTHVGLLLPFSTSMRHLFLMQINLKEESDICSALRGMSRHCMQTNECLWSWKQPHFLFTEISGTNCKKKRKKKGYAKSQKKKKGEFLL